MQAVENYLKPIGHDFKLTNRVSIISIIFFFCAFFMVHLWNFSTHLNRELQQISQHLDRDFNDAINYSSSVIHNILTNPNIPIESSKDLSHIFSTLGQKKFDMLHWSALLRVDEDLNLVASNRLILPESSSVLSERPYLRKTRAVPYELHVGEPVYGVLSKEWTVPMAMGYKENDVYRGALVTGIIIPSITTHLLNNILPEDISLQVTFHSRAILQTEHMTIDELTPLSLIKALFLSSSQRVSLLSPLNHYPPVIKISFNRAQLLGLFFEEWLPYLLLIPGILIPLFGVVRFTKHRIITPIENLARDVDDIHYHYKLLNRASLTSILDQPANEVSKIKSAMLLTNYLLAQQQESDTAIYKTREALQDMISSQLFVLTEIRESSKELKNNLQRLIDASREESFLPEYFNHDIEKTLCQTHMQHMMAQDSISVMKHYFDVTKNGRQETDIAQLTYSLVKDLQQDSPFPLKVKVNGKATRCQVFKEALAESIKKALSILYYSLDDTDKNTAIIIQSSILSEGANLLSYDFTCDLKACGDRDDIITRFSNLEKDSPFEIKRHIYMIKMFSLLNGGLISFSHDHYVLNISCYFPNVVSYTHVIDAEKDAKIYQKALEEA